MIELKSVSKEYGGKRKVAALQDVTLRIDAGELVGIVGPSGSGKSTLLNLMSGIDQPTRGEIWIGGVLLNGLSDDDLTRLRRDKVGLIFQFFNLLPSLTALENFALPLHFRGWPATKIRERAAELFALVGLSDRQHHLPGELSGGERQRVAIARALAANPSLLLADEPTGNLDSQTGERILALLKDLHNRLGATLVIVTHDNSIAARCPRRIVVRDGRVAEDARQQSVLSENA